MNDALNDSMFWVGALFAFTPIVVGGAAIGIWWWQRRREAAAREALRDADSSGAPVQR